MKGVPRKILDLAGHPLLHRKPLRTGIVLPSLAHHLLICVATMEQKVEDQPLSLSSTILLGTACSF